VTRDQANKNTSTAGKTAIVAGATGLVGRELVHQLSANPAYSQVIALTRRTGMFKSMINVIEQPFPQGSDSLIADEFYCALGTTIKKAGSQVAFHGTDHDLVLDLAKRCKNGGVTRVVVVTAIGSDLNSPFFYSKVKGETERDLKSLNLPKLEIYQPSLLLGKRDEFRLGEKVGEFFAAILSPVFVGSLTKYRPIHAADLARKMIMGEPLN
jgi:uncharacterized protein YbjT (DUF2867 family)